MTRTPAARRNDSALARVEPEPRPAPDGLVWVSSPSPATSASSTATRLQRAAQVTAEADAGMLAGSARPRRRGEPVLPEPGSN